MTKENINEDYNFIKVQNKLKNYNLLNEIKPSYFTSKHPYNAYKTECELELISNGKYYQTKEEYEKQKLKKGGREKNIIVITDFQTFLEKIELH